MTEICLHQPEPHPGVRCVCFECRTAQMGAFQAIAAQCYRCAGRCATDAHGQVTCEKGDYACPILDLWYAVINRQIDPTRIDPIQVELIYNRHKDPPKRYKRVGLGSDKWNMIPNPNLPPVVARPARRAVKRPILSAAENVPGKRKAQTRA